MTKKPKKKNLLKRIILILAVLIFLAVVLLKLSGEKKTTTTTTGGGYDIARLSDVDLLFASFFGTGACEGAGEQGGCYAYNFLYQSGRFINESGHQANNKTWTKVTTERQFSQNSMDNIISEIRSSGILQKNCSASLDLDVSVFHQIKLDSVKKTFGSLPPVECQKILDKIDALIESAGAGSPVLTPTPTNAVNNASKFFDFVDGLDNFPTLTPDDVFKKLHITMTKTEASNPYYLVGEAKGSNIAEFFTSIELRTPIETNKGGLLIFDLKDNLGITEKDVLKKYPKAIPELTEATAPFTVPYDWKVKTSWGKISFQITRDGSKRVVAVIFDSID